MEGFRVVRKETVMNEIDIFVTATGNKDIITLEDMTKMKNNAIVGNIGHFDNEIQMDRLNAYKGVEKVNVKPQTDIYKMPEGH
jgi:adenosylhomocysteinase